MPPIDKALDQILDLGNPVVRRNRVEQTEQAMRMALTLMDADAVIVRMPASRSGKRLALYARSPATATLAGTGKPSVVIPRLTENSRPLVFTNLVDDTAIAGVDDCPGIQSGPAVFLPLRQRDPAPGYMAVYRGPGRAPFNTGDVRQLLLLATWLSGAFECLRLSSGVERLAVTDDLTDVYNTRFLVSALGREIRRAARYNQEVSIVRLDIDDLDAFKRERGELLGSVLLKEFAAQLAKSVRPFDLLARYEGDSFIVMLPQTSREGAVEVAGRLHAAIAAHVFTPLEVQVTASVEIACFPAEGAEASELLAALDRWRDRTRERTSIARANAARVSNGAAGKPSLRPPVDRSASAY